MTIARASCICERCGKEFEVVTKRPNRRDADNFEGWAEENITVCPECRNREKEETYQREAEAARKKAEERGLPELKGSEKQIRWALVVREKRIGEIEQIIREAEKLAVTDKERKILSSFKAYAEKLFFELDASYWIESRNLEAADLVWNYHRTMMKQER